MACAIHLRAETGAPSWNRRACRRRPGPGRAGRRPRPARSPRRWSGAARCPAAAAPGPPWGRAERRLPGIEGDGALHLGGRQQRHRARPRRLLRARARPGGRLALRAGSLARGAALLALHYLARARAAVRCVEAGIIREVPARARGAWGLAADAAPRAATTACWSAWSSRRALGIAGALARLRFLAISQLAIHLVLAGEHLLDRRIPAISHWAQDEWPTSIIRYQPGHPSASIPR